MSGFDWNTEGDATWSETEWQTESIEPRRRRPHWYVWLLLVSAIVAIAVVFRQAQERASLAVNQARDELLATHDLLLSALAQNDQELFYSLLSGRDKSWTDAQRLMFDGGSLFHPGFLSPIASQDDSSSPDNLPEREPAVTAVELSPNMLAGEIVVSVQHELENPDGTTETVTLERTTVYRRGNSRWLLAPPLPDFWGRAVRIRREVLTLVSPERDSELAGRLASDLDSMLLDLCRILDVDNCREELRLSVLFETDVSSLIEADDASVEARQGDEFTLPTPSLLGTPIDEPGYQALYHAYADKVAAAAVAQLSGWQCCAHAMLYQALLEWELSQLGLDNWPVQDETYFRIVDEELEIADIAHFWLIRNQSRLQDRDGWQVYLFLDFLIRRFPEVSVADMQRELSQHLTLEDWLNALYLSELGLGDDFSLMVRLEADWIQSALDYWQQGQPPAPIPMPEQNLLLGCVSTGDSESARIYRYDFGSESWTLELTDFGFLFFMNATPDDELLLVSGLVNAESEDGAWQTGIWDGSDFHPVLPDNRLVIALGQMDPTGKDLVLFIFEDADVMMPIAALVDLDQCLEGDCDVISLGGIPMWSPDGQQMLLMADESLGNSRLVTGDRHYLFNVVGAENAPNTGWSLVRLPEVQALSEVEGEQIALGNGTAPFWFSETVYGYVRSRQPSGLIGDEELVLASVTDDAPEVATTLLELQFALADRPPIAALAILDAMVSPVDSSKLLLALGNSLRQTLSVLSFDLETGEQENLLTIEMGLGGSIGLSPGGRWLTVSGAEAGGSTEGGNGVLALYRFENGQILRYEVQNTNVIGSPGYDWAEGGEWLATIPGDNVLTIVAPEHDYQYLIGHGFGLCTAVTWFTP